MILFGRLTCLLVTTFVLSGCADTAMVATRLDPATGQLSETSYSGLFIGRGQIVPGRIELALVAEMEPEEASALHSLKQSLGALGPDDMSRPARALAIFHNQTKQSLEIDLTRLDGPWQQHLVMQPAHLVLPAGKTIQHPLGRLALGTYMTTAEFDLEFQHIGKTGKGRMTLERQYFTLSVGKTYRGQRQRERSCRG